MSIKEIWGQTPTYQSCYDERTSQIYLAMESCMDNEIKVFDKKLKKCNNSTDNIRAIEVNTDREVYKRNGLHMKQKGKKQKR